MSAVDSKQVQKARSFLYSHHKRAFGIKPHKFAASAQELGVGFRDLMSFISIQYARGQNEGVFRKDNLRQIAAHSR